MIFRVLGGGREVGRSAILMKDELSIMLDFGIKLDHKTEYPIAMPQVDAIVLSHAHLDHSGFVPAYYKNMNIPTIGTKPTMELSKLLLNDAISISKKEHNKQEFNKKSIEAMEGSYKYLDYHRRVALGNYDIEFYDAGHICGSAITLIERAKASNYNRIVYTGDFKLSKQVLHDGAEIVKSDILITESTYAQREHPDRDELIKKFVEEIKETLDNGGIALLPAFAVGRSQELLSILYKNGLAEYTYMDGMCKEATRIVAKNSKYLSNGALLQNALEKTNIIGKQNERKGLLDESKIVLTTAGMLNGGPVLQYITNLNSKSKIFITGYQIENTNGRLLIDTGYIIKDKKKIKISTPVSVYDFSAHAGDADLHRYIRESAPNIVICLHGDEKPTMEFAEELNNEGFEAYAPKVGDTVKLAE
ncbi:MAG: MBL fold metallo-hydrolase [Candidatus Micrarchaeaceae archaeon]